MNEYFLNESRYKIADGDKNVESEKCDNCVKPTFTVGTQEVVVDGLNSELIDGKNGERAEKVQPN